MKKAGYFLIISFGLVAYLPKAEAQFLKKLKESATKVADETFSTNETEKGSNGTRNKNGSKVDKDDLNLTEYQITVTNAGTASFKAGEFFMENYSSISLKNNAITATTVVGVLTEKEQLSESGDGDGSDVAYIFENGKKIKETIVKDLDKNLTDFTTQNDWYPELSALKNEDNNSYITMDSQGRNYQIKFNGKTFGPFVLVQNMIVNKNRTKFYALVVKDQKALENMTYSLFSSDNLLYPAGVGGDILVNVDFTNAAIVQSLITKYAATLASEEDETKQALIQKQMAETMMQHPYEGDVYFTSGKNLHSILTTSAWLDNHGTNIFSIQVDSTPNMEKGLYLNGKKIDDIVVAQGWAWCNATATNWAFQRDDLSAYNPKHLVFKDGTDIPGVIHPQQLVIGDKNYIVWFMYDRTRSDEIKLCSREL